MTRLGSVGSSGVAVGIEHVFLDLDGTLTDPAPGILASFRHAVDALGVTGWPDERLVRLIGPPLRDAFAAILGASDPARIDRGIALYRTYFTERGMLENAAIDGIPAALEALRERGYTLHLATSKPRVFAQRIVEHFGLADQLAGVYGAKLSGERADKAELLAYALEQVGVCAAHSVMVGDRMHDVRGARAVGMCCIGVLWGYGSEPELVAARPDRLLYHVAELVPTVIELDATRRSDSR